MKFLEEAYTRESEDIPGEKKEEQQEGSLHKGKTKGGVSPNIAPQRPANMGVHTTYLTCFSLFRLFSCLA